MPTYEYECRSCSHLFEKFQSITSRPARKCPSCGEQAAKRLISGGGGIIFKGSGFYQTDYRSDSYKKAAKADTETKSSTTKDKTDDTTKSPATTAGSGDSGGKQSGGKQSGGKQSGDE